MRLKGILKVIGVLLLDYYVVWFNTGNAQLTFIVLIGITIYVLFGGYLSLLKEQAISMNDLPCDYSSRLNSAREVLIQDVMNINSLNMSGIKLYVTPFDDMNATAYGNKCISITKGTLDNTDIVTLVAVLSHEMGHIINYDAELQRALFCLVSLIILELSALSFLSVLLIFLIFLFFNLFRSYMGFLLFTGASKLVRTIFRAFQYMLVFFYKSLLGFTGRSSEYRADAYCIQLGYGSQLAQFLEISSNQLHHEMTLTEILYRSHPATEKRVARIREHSSKNTMNK